MGNAEEFGNEGRRKYLTEVTNAADGQHDR